MPRDFRSGSIKGRTDFSRQSKEETKYKDRDDQRRRCGRNRAGLFSLIRSIERNAADRNNNQTNYAVINFQGPPTHETIQGVKA
jgi:hypothetical protein